MVNNLFGGLHFVSCGSRGIEPFPVLQFVSVFEWKVWAFILVFITLQSVVIVVLRDGLKYTELFCRVLSIYKALLEQGDPFPNNFYKALK